MTDALSNVNVVEFGGYAAGPAIGKYLANFGARVVHVESDGRPDGFRLQYPPFKDGLAGLNRGGCFCYFNDSKYGVTIDLKNEEGIAAARALIEWSDLLIENMRPGVMGRLGLDYDALKEIKPELIMLSTSNMGQSGPWSRHPGFGSQLSSLSGFTELIGEPDGPPGFLYGPYIDLIAVAYGGAAVLAALDYKRRTGKGVFIDLSQYEAGVQFIAPAMLELAATGRVAQRCGNADPVAVPHGCFRCADGEWCVISCWSDDEFKRLCEAAGHPQWFRHDKELNEQISQWTATRQSRSVMELLQSRGVHAGAVNKVSDLFTDPQLAARHTWQAVEHPEIGSQHYRMVSYQLSETPGRVRSAAPCLGQHNDEVLSDWLDLDVVPAALQMKRR